MFKHILVPLDGSMRGEQALHVAARIARANQSSLLLLEAIDPIDKMGLSTLPNERLLLDMENRYLQNIARGPELAGIEVTIQACIGIAAEQILLAVDNNHIDLVVMCSHGRTGLKRWTLGSVAQKISRYCPAPVLVLNEHDQLQQQLQTQIPSPVRILVALDGSERAETSIALAADLSMALSAPARGVLQLTYVIHLPSSFEYGQEDSVARALEKETPPAQAYLQAVKQRLQTGELKHSNLEITTVLTHDLDVASKLIKIAEWGEKQDGHSCCQMIALTTHGRSGLQRWITGSITERILSKACISLLITRPASDE
ncbi:universal stress protein [Dictyobacter kobayashii]|uniref:Universal stress protein UspA n=1 Tax=Dictyobacter kobayashii TaxID=2014872 RepID=A0A402ANJ1_9CHLR|nr:universal stress protein [Dictyobacter kobayashii]GCE20540.1 universal stress protein UspA [Dictyobacter kobayashii]